MSRIKECFDSRWKPDGVLLEADFSQLEVIGLATLTMDPQLIKDIASGMDLHTVRAAELFGISEKEVTKEQRRLAKAFSFQLQYGAGAKSMAEKNDVDIHVAKRFIENYYSRYPKVAEWQEATRIAVEAAREPTADSTPKGYPKGRSVLESVTGRLYTFREYDAPEWKRDRTPSFSPTEMKNYPVQGFATADVMALYRGRVYRNLLANEHLRGQVLPINTVHDSIMFDCREIGVAFELDLVLQEEAVELPRLIKKLWDVECPLPFPIKSKVGKTWGKMKPINELEAV
jgi:DNA polymerase I